MRHGSGWSRWLQAAVLLSAACSSKSGRDRTTPSDLAIVPAADLASGAAADLASGAAVDLSVGGPDAGGDLARAPDLGRTGPGCFALLSGASDRFSPQRSKDLRDSFMMCAIGACGSQQVVDGGNAAKPCAQFGPDGGLTQSCDLCFANIQVNDTINFVDATGATLVCRDPATGTPNTSAMYCGACATEIVSCVLDCNSDLDCRGLTYPGGVIAICIDNVCGV